MIFSPVALNEDILVSGVELKTSESTLFEDLPALSKKYAKIRPHIQFQIKPLTTCVASGPNKVFMGDFVLKKNKEFKNLYISKGIEAVKVNIPVHSQLTLPAKVAKIRKRFYDEWLPSSGYRSFPEWKDLEVYHYRRRYFRKSRKMIMELWFLIEKSEKNEN